MGNRLVLVDDQELVRRGVAAVLCGESDLEVVGQFSSATQALDAMADLEPDAVIMDLAMPGTSGAQQIVLLRERHPSVRVLVLTVSEQAADLRAALRAGAYGYVLKSATPQELIHAVRQVAEGWVVVAPAMAGKLMADFPENGVSLEVGTAAETLSAREWDVLHLLADGLSNREIADQLVVSENTVKTHMRSILAKFHFKNRAQAAAHLRRIERAVP